MEKKYNNHLQNSYLKALVRLSVFLSVFLLAGLSTSFAQWGETINVSSERELIEAMDNERVEVIVLAPGYYEYLDMEVTFDAPGAHRFTYLWDNGSSAHPDHVWYAYPDLPYFFKKTLNLS